MLPCGQVGGKRRVQCHQHSTAAINAALVCWMERNRTREINGDVKILLSYTQHSLTSAT